MFFQLGANFCNALQHPSLKLAFSKQLFHFVTNFLPARMANMLVDAAGWEKICHDMEELFRKGEFEAGVLQGIAEISAELEKHFSLIDEPLTRLNKNEISNKPLIL